MKNKSFIALAILALFGCSVISFFSQNTFYQLFGIKRNDIRRESDWSIKNYDVDIYLKENGEFDVIERITADFDTYKHGIFRTIPLLNERRDNGKTTNAFLDIEVIEVMQDGKNAMVSISTDKDLSYHQDILFRTHAKNLIIKIGDPDVTITDEVEYKILYKVRNGLSKDSDGNTQFYWNGIGTGWGVPIEKSSISLTSNLLKDDTSPRCFTGTYGNNESNCELEINGDKVTFNSTLSLSPGEAFTVLAELDQAKISAYDKNIGGDGKEYLKLILANWFVVLPVFPFLLLVLVWFKTGRPPKTRGIIAPRFDAPNNLSPIQSGLIVDEFLDNIDISSSILNLAVGGYMKIKEDGDDYIFTKLTPNRPKPISQFDQYLYDEIFKSGETALLSSFKNTFYTKIAQVKKDINSWGVSEGYFSRTPGLINCPLALVYLLSLPSAIILFITGSIPMMASCFFFLFLSIPFFGSYQSYTKKGKEMQEELLGLKMYIKTAEKDRIEYLNAPERTPELFERLLPYAMALGVVEIWADKFRDIYTTPPSWYEGNWATFNTVNFAHSISSASTQFNSVMTSSPSSSGSSGGGGFSGGGGGGGGGGSW